MKVLGKPNRQDQKQWALEEELNEDVNAKLERMLGDAPQPQLSPEQEKEPKHRIVAPKFSVLKARALSPSSNSMNMS